MKLDKRFILMSALVLGFGVGAVACSDEDDNAKNEEVVCNDADHKKLNEDGTACICYVGYDENEKGECIQQEITCDASKHEVLNEEGTGCKCDTGYHGENGECKEDITATEGCGDGILQEDEVCDTDSNGVSIFKEGYAHTCTDWAKENASTESTTATYTGAPVCGKTCKTMAKGTCESDLCGNGVIDTGESCDTKDGQIIFASSITDQSCMGTYKSGSEGIPGCASDCKSFSKGTCSDGNEKVAVHGVESCKATITIEGENISGSAEVAVSAGLKANGTILCGINSLNVSLVNQNLTLDSADTDGKISSSTVKKTEAGVYSCMFYVETEKGKGVACSADGTVQAASGSLKDYELASYTVESQQVSGVIAQWTAFSYLLNEKGYPAGNENVYKIMSEGVVDESNTNPDMKLTFKRLNDALTINVTKDADASTYSTLIIGKGSAMGTGHAKDTNSHLLIAPISLSAEASLSLKYSTAGGKAAITYTTEENGTETDLKTDLTTEKDVFATEVVTVPAAAKEIRIYAYDYADTDQNFRVDDIILTAGGSAEEN